MSNTLHSLRESLIHNTLQNGFIGWYDTSQSDQPTFWAKIRRTGFYPACQPLIIDFYWVVAQDQPNDAWHRVWCYATAPPPDPPVGRSGQGLWATPPEVGIQHGRISIPYPRSVEPLVVQHRVVVSYQDDTGRWFGLDCLQPLQEFHLESQAWQLRIIQPLPPRADQHPQTLSIVSKIVGECRFNSWYEGAPYYSDLIEVA